MMSFFYVIIIFIVNYLFLIKNKKINYVNLVQEKVSTRVRMSVLPPDRFEQYVNSICQIYNIVFLLIQNQRTQNTYSISYAVHTN